MFYPYNSFAVQRPASEASPPASSASRCWPQCVVFAPLPTTVAVCAARPNAELLECGRKMAVHIVRVPRDIPLAVSPVPVAVCHVVNVLLIAAIRPSVITRHPVLRRIILSGCAGGEVSPRSAPPRNRLVFYSFYSPIFREESA